MFEPLYTAPEMRTAEEAYPGYPETVPELMERAGAAVAKAVAEHFPGASVVAVCGKGSNGGDGRIAAQKLGGRIVEVGELPGPIRDADVVIDAVFGTGFRGEPRPDAARQIDDINASHAHVVSVDVPSGVDASTGEVAAQAVDAALTVTFHGRKLGLVVAPGRFHAGIVEVADIGLEPAFAEHVVVTKAVLEEVPRKSGRDHKYSGGAVLVVGGSTGMTGAVCLAAEAAFRADAGYVTVCAPHDSLPVVEARVLEAVKRPLEEVFDAAERAGAIALGPGLGRSPEHIELVRRVLQETDVPAVVDADALYALEPLERQAPTVLTPHAGELARLLGEKSDWVSAHRLQAVRRGAERFGTVCLLKGADTLVGSPDGSVIVSDFGPATLATAGTGDVLTGVVAAFLAKGMPPELAAAAAATAHGLAARRTGLRAGLVAHDVVEALPHVLSD